MTICYHCSQFLTACIDVAGHGGCGHCMINAKVSQHRELTFKLTPMAHPAAAHHTGKDRLSTVGISIPISLAFTGATIVNTFEILAGGAVCTWCRDCLSWRLFMLSSWHSVTSGHCSNLVFLTMLHVPCACRAPAQRVSTVATPSAAAPPSMHGNSSTKQADKENQPPPAATANKTVTQPAHDDMDSGKALDMWNKQFAATGVPVTAEGSSKLKKPKNGRKPPAKQKRTAEGGAASLQKPSQRNARGAAAAATESGATKEPEALGGGKKRGRR